jgi:hypothetical protein
MEYTKTVYNGVTHDYESELIIGILDVNIWNKVFGKLDLVLKYYVHLLTNYKGVLDIEPKMPVYLQGQMMTTYVAISFQEYIDSMINIQTIGAMDYQIFMKNMEIPEFKEKMVVKYTTDSIYKMVKNHFIYIVNLHIIKQLTRFENLISYSEEEDMDMMMNAIPYFNLLSEKMYSIEDIEDDVITDPLNTTIDEFEFHQLELRTMKMINNTF